MDCRPLAMTAETAAAVHAVMVAAYRVEAALLGVDDFVPLRRNAEAIRTAPSTFFGAFLGDGLAAVVELEALADGTTNVASLVVLPEHFRRGLGSALLRYAIDLRGGGPITVSTGVRNLPALQLYARHGFREQRRWTTPDGIPMVTLVR